MPKAVNTLLGLLPQFRTLGKAEVNDFVGKLKVAAHCTGLILNEGKALLNFENKVSSSSMTGFKLTSFMVLTPFVDFLPT